MKIKKYKSLIFDLDGDHLPGVSDRDFPSMLELIQEGLIKALQDVNKKIINWDEVKE